MGDLLDAVMQQLPADKRPKDLRLLEIFNGKIYQASIAGTTPCQSASILPVREQMTHICAVT